MIPINSNRKRNSISVWYLDILKARDVLNHPSIFYLLSLNQLPLTVKHQNAVLKNRWTEHIWLQSMRTLDHRCHDNGKHQQVLKREPWHSVAQVKFSHWEILSGKQKVLPLEKPWEVMYIVPGLKTVCVHLITELSWSHTGCNCVIIMGFGLKMPLVKEPFEFEKKKMWERNIFLLYNCSTVCCTSPVF